MTIETVHMTYSMIEAYGLSFDGRTRVLDVSLSRKAMIYPELMLVNKTLKTFIYNEKQVLRKRSNDFFMCQGESSLGPISFSVLGYGKAEIDVRTVEQQAELEMLEIEVSNQKKKKKLKDGMRGRLLFGISVTQADFPYGKTKIVNLVPRYTILNKLSRRICVR